MTGIIRSYNAAPRYHFPAWDRKIANEHMISQFIARWSGVTASELVLWIGYSQLHIRTRGNKAVAEPVVPG
jgi:hypothetical protein